MCAELARDRGGRELCVGTPRPAGGGGRRALCGTVEDAGSKPVDADNRGQMVSKAGGGSPSTDTDN